MQGHLAQLFENDEVVKRIKNRLPYLFQLAELESSRAGKVGMQVGSIRENIIVALLIYKFGEENVETEIPITEPEVDVRLFEELVSIKTITGSFSGVKVIWTVDAAKAKEFRENYYPICDILLVRINWDDIGGLYYIPVQVQRRLFDEIGREKYVKLPKPGTNPRGVEFAKNVLARLTADGQSKQIEINWKEARLGLMLIKDGLICGKKTGMANNRTRRGTKTSPFGAPARIGHDSSRFYNSRLYAERRPPEKVKFIENPIPNEHLDKIYCKSSEVMGEIPDYSLHLMVTSPPYNVTKEYDEDLSLEEYRDLLRAVFKETYKKLVTGGRACVNVANLGRKPYIPLHRYIIEDMLDIGFFMRGEILWNKASSASASTAWGSWLSASNPVLRDIHEYILVFSKESFSRKRRHKKSTISRDEFLEWTKSVWTFPAVSARSIGHPAPFPVELPYRLIQLYTFEGDIVLDPFIGSGQTAIAAIKAKRRYVGYEISEEYVKLAKKRVKKFDGDSALPKLFDTENKKTKQHNPVPANAL